MKMNSLKCIWSQEDENSDIWSTSCGENFILNEGTPEENKFKFCNYCGKEIEQDEWKGE